MLYRVRFLAIASAFGLSSLGVLNPAVSHGTEADFDTFAASASVTTDAPLNDLFSRQWVRSDASGRVSGSLVQLTDKSKLPVEGLPIVLVQNGKIAYSAKSDAEGNFSYEGVKPGQYSLISRTNESIAVFAVQVLDATAAEHLPTNIEVRIIRSAGEKIKEIVAAQTVPSDLSSISSLKKVNVDPLATGRRFANSSVVRLNETGRLEGQVARSGISVSDSRLQGMSIYVLKDGAEVARSEVDVNGHFSVGDLTEGAYGFIAAGSNGFVATSFQVVEAKVAKLTASGDKFVGLNQNGCCPQLNCEVVESCEVVTCEVAQVCETVIETPVVETCEVISEPIVEEVILEEACGQTCGCGGGMGGFSGGGYGGGGGGFGGGGFGNLLSLGALAGIAAAVGRNDNNNNGGFIVNQPPVKVSPN